MNIFTKPGLITKLYTLCLCLTVLNTNTNAQLPTCTGASANLIYYVGDSSNFIVYIWNFDPTLPLSGSNPVVNSIVPPPTTIGLSLGKNLNAASPATTFYACDGVSDYYYYNGTSWVNTGYNTGNPAAVNPGSGGNYIYNMDGLNGNIYRYDGTANGTLLMAIPTWNAFNSSGPFDMQGDCAGNFYILNTGASPQWLNEYNSSATLLHTWTLSGAPVSNLGGGMAIIGNMLYYHNNLGSGNFCGGPISSTNVAVTTIIPGGLPHNPEDFSSCPLGGTFGSLTTDTTFYCGTGPAIQLSSPGSPPYTWTVVSGPAVISNVGTTGDSVSVTASATSRIRVTSLPGSVACSSNIDTFLVVVPGVVASAHAGLSDSIPGCGKYVDSLHAAFTSNAPWLHYHYKWTPAAAVLAGDTTLNPIIKPVNNTKYLLTVTTDTTQGNCLWKDSMNAIVIDRTVSAAFTDTIEFGCQADVVILNHTINRDLHMRWNFGDSTAIDSTNSSPIHTYSKQGIYTIQLFVKNELCKDSIPKSINTRHLIKADFTIPKELLCQGESVLYTNTSVDTTRNGIAPSYNWYFGDGGTSNAVNATYAYTYEDTGNYTIMMVAQDFVPCYDTAYQLVTVISKPNGYVMDSGFCNPNTNIAIGMMIKNADSYVWSTGSKSPFVIPDTSGIYTVTTTNHCGSDMSSVKVTLYDCDKCLFVPNAFTPNDDGLNDVFHVRMICPIRTYGIKIFSRFGEMVYSSYYVNQGWDGKINGTPADVGTYFYEITYTPDLPNAHELHKKGDLTLIR